jgi:hypothetical protein
MDHLVSLAIQTSGSSLASRASLQPGRRTLLTGAQPGAQWRSCPDLRRSTAARAVEDTTAAATEAAVPVPRPPKRPAGMSAVQQSKEYGWFASQLPEGEVSRFRYAAAGRRPPPYRQLDAGHHAGHRQCHRQCSMLGIRRCLASACACRYHSAAPSPRIPPLQHPHHQVPDTSQQPPSAASAGSPGRPGRPRTAGRPAAHPPPAPPHPPSTAAPPPPAASHPPPQVLAR